MYCIHTLWYLSNGMCVLVSVLLIHNMLLYLVVKGVLPSIQRDVIMIASGNKNMKTSG